MTNTQKDLEIPKNNILCICSYAIICSEANNCIHAGNHTPLFRARTRFTELMVFDNIYRNKNCLTIPGRIGRIIPESQTAPWRSCPDDIPEDRICIDVNAKEIADRIARKFSGIESEAILQWLKEVKNKD